MNTGAFGENFPYSNFHDLNMDWIIKIAKDFLDQYTGIQDLIDTGKTDIQNLTQEGLEGLQGKYEELSGLLDTWYETHSEDIAEQLADALESLQNALGTAITEFNSRAVAIGQDVVESIPEDYTALSNTATGNRKALINHEQENGVIYFTDIFDFLNTTSDGLTYTKTTNGLIVTGTQTDITNKQIYEGPLPDQLKADTPYFITFNPPKDCVLQIFGYTANNDARTLYSSIEQMGVLVIPSAYSSRIMVRFRFPTNRTVWNDTIYASFHEASNKETVTAVDNLVNLDYVESTTIYGITLTVDKQKGTIKVNGTATANFEMYISDVFTGLHEVICSGAASGGGRSTYYIGIYEEGASRIGWLDGTETYKVITLDPTKQYTARIYVLRGVTVNNAVFTPVIWGNEYIYDISNALSEGVSEWRLYKGCCAIFVAGASVKIQARSFRLFNVVSKTYSTALTDDITLPLADDIETVRYIHYDGSNFSLNSTFGSDVIASVGDKSVRTFLDRGIITDHPLIPDGYIRVGSAYHLNLDRAGINAYAEYDGDYDVKLADKAYKYTTAGTKRYTYDYNVLSFTLTQNTTGIQNKKILMIGDSFVARGYIQHYLKEFEPTLQFIGTKTTQHYDFKSEGVSGSRLYYFTDPETSPFYYNNALDLSAYLHDNSLPAPDYVIINSAINHGSYNDATYGTYHANLMALIDMIRDYSANIKIYVTYGANFAMTIPSTYGYPVRRMEEVLKCINSVYDTENVTIIPVNTALIDTLDYPVTTYNYYGSNITMYPDCVHPTEEAGFKKIAEMCYNYLGI